ncbi:MAG: lipopolysaccharide biosynthesis protein [Dysgonamonadaceae bacterium]|jgi:O-antigen/teichoic acid export membrane protein|nr:lipopolysaccharide biosynthesis protein [Dysgonamonadaceae bacterium]HTO14130.1 lipopolysaccharide biosynthesis protein [Edaphocola sp.]
MSLRKQATSGMMWTFAQQFSTQGIGFIISVVLARLLLPAEFGIIGMIAIFMGIGGALVDSGLASSLIRTPDANEEDFSTVFYFNILGSILIYFILYLTAPFIANFFDQPILKNITRVYGITFIINAFSTIQLTRLTQKMDFKTQMIVSVPALIGGGIVGITLAYLGHGVWSLVWMRLIQSFLNSVQLWIVTKWKPSLIFNIAKFKYHFNFGYKLLLSGLLDTVFTNIYTVIIGKFFLPAQLGFYTRASSVVRMPVDNISGALHKVTYPLFAQIKDDNERLKKVYKQILQMISFLIAPTLIIMGVLATPLFRFLFTEKWLPAVPYFQILCISGFMYPFHFYNLNILNVKGRSDLFLKLEIIKKILLVITILLSIPFGIYGLLWGMVISSALALSINAHYSGKFIHYSGFKQIKDVLPILLIALIAGALTLTIDRIMINFKVIDIFRIIIGISVGVLSYWAMAVVFKFQSIQDIKTIIIRKYDTNN